MISIERKEEEYIVEMGSRVGSKHGGSEDVSGYILSPHVVGPDHIKNGEELVERLEYINENTRRVE